MQVYSEDIPSSIHMRKVYIVFAALLNYFGVWTVQHKMFFNTGMFWKLMALSQLCSCVELGEGRTSELAVIPILKVS